MQVVSEATGRELWTALRGPIKQYDGMAVYGIVLHRNVCHACQQLTVGLQVVAPASLCWQWGAWPSFGDYLAAPLAGVALRSRLIRVSWHAC
jgi:hypothetical protein